MPGSPGHLEGSPISSVEPSSPHSRSPPAAQPQPTNQKTSARGRPLGELIGTQFPPFDCECAIVVPFQNETARDEAFQKELNEMLLDASLAVHAWASARPFQETEMVTREFERDIMSLQATENEQEKTRQRLNDFVTRMRSALAALTEMDVL
ncbi:hypothetical protein B0H12DRAFT_251300 [Mycena haematopus]|nr:hypothetical protein B0H12DRAFT_251300 [Mycena haematopus]